MFDPVGEPCGACLVEFATLDEVFSHPCPETARRKAARLAWEPSPPREADVAEVRRLIAKKADVDPIRARLNQAAKEGKLTSSLVVDAQAALLELPNL